MRDTKAVIFDFDGTIANSIDLVLDIVNQNAEKHGYLQIDPAEIPRLRKLGYRGAMKEKGIKLRQLVSLVLEFRDDMKKRIGEIQPYNGMKDQIQDLIDQGCTVGVLTSNQADLVDEFLHEHQFPKMDFIVSEKTLFGKDRALKKIMKTHGLSAENTIYVGDEPRDVTASHKAGLKVIGVSWGFAGREGFEHAQPDVLINKPSELNKTIKKLLK